MAKASATRNKLLYDVHPGVAVTQKWITELKTKTGRSLDDWIMLLRKEGPKDEHSRREWLKTKHKLGTNTAGWLAQRAQGKGLEDSDSEAYLKAAAQWVEEQYLGKKEKLRPIYDELLSIGKALGPDVRACPCKTIVPLYRKHVFAQIKPTTNTRIDLGLCLTHYAGKIPRRILETGGMEKKDRITHRIPIESAAAIDHEVREWMQAAYDLDI